MAGRHQPIAGADSADALRPYIDTLDIGCTTPGCWATWTAGETHECEWRPVPWNVLVEEEMGSRIQIRVNAIGRHDAEHLACEEARVRGYYDVTALRAEPAA